MKTRILKSMSVCAVLLVCAVSFASAATECNIVSSSIPWNESDQGTWVSDTYELTIVCTDNGSPVEGYQAKFDISLMSGADWANKIATLTTYSTPTNSSGIARINVPLIHILRDDNTYIHICPFDDIQCTGGVSSSSQVAPPNSSGIASLTAASTDCINPVLGCCETTITVSCCTPNISFTYCTTTTQGQCAVGTTHPDPCTNITTTWHANGVCNYCTGICEDQTLITLSKFKAISANRKVILVWVTESETHNAGFNILRADSEDGPYTQINDSIIQSKGSSVEGAGYHFFDTTVKNRQTYYYKLEDLDINDGPTQHGPVHAMPRLIFGKGLLKWLINK